MPVRFGYFAEGAEVLRTLANWRIGLISTRSRMNSFETSAGAR